MDWPPISSLSRRNLPQDSPNTHIPWNGIPLQAFNSLAVTNVLGASGSR